MGKVAIGLGSNVGQRQQMIEQAIAQLQQIHAIKNMVVSTFIETAALLPPDAPKEWDMPFLNAVAICETTLTAHELLEVFQEIERQTGRSKQGLWSPRTLDLDLLLYDDMMLNDEELLIPHPEMLKRDFVMQPLIELAPQWIHPVTRKAMADHTITQLMGIVNVTPDSFSDGGLAETTEAAVAHARELIAHGADLLDIGAESTRPNATPVSAEQEWQRLEPVLQALQSETVLSVDTRHEQTTINALSLGVEIINDVSAATNDGLIRAVANHDTAKYVLMHSLSVPADPSITLEGDVVDEVLSFAKDKIAYCESLGLAKSRIIFDVGIGFGKTAEQSLELIERICEFNVLGVPLLVGHSRKSFISLFTDKPPSQRDDLTVKFSKQMAAKAVEYLRVHNIEAHHGL